MQSYMVVAWGPKWKTSVRLSVESAPRFKPADQCGKECTAMQTMFSAMPPGILGLGPAVCLLMMSECIV